MQSMMGMTRWRNSELVAVACVVAAITCVLPSTALATDARPVAQIPMPSAAYELELSGVSADGGQILANRVDRSRGYSEDPSLWALETATGTTRQLAGRTRRASQSPAGDWAAWQTIQPDRICSRAIWVARTDGSEPAQRLLLPGAYARSAISGLTVGAGGRVTVRVGRCRDDFEPSGNENRAILTADPGSKTLRVLVSSRSIHAKWPVSQDGRVFALCRPVKAGKRRTAEVTVIDSDPQLKRSAATLSYNYAALEPQCVASDAGTATMTAIRRRPGAPTGARARLGDYRRAGVSIGGDRTRRFLLPYGLAVKDHQLEAASPNGDEVLTSVTGLSAASSLGATRGATVIKTATGRHSRTFKNPALHGVVGILASESEPTDGQPIVPWDPFAPALVIAGYGRMRIFDPHTLKSSRTLRYTGRNDLIDLTACFLASGRVMLKIRDQKRAASRLFISDVKRSRFTQLDTSQLGAVSSVSCSASASGRMFLAVASTGVVYEVAANTIDDSPLRASS